MVKGKLNFRQLVNGSIRCGQLPIVAWSDPTHVLSINPKPKHFEAKEGDTGCDSSNFTVWRTQDQIDVHKTLGKFDFMVTCLECRAVMAVHADIWKDMRA